MIFFQQEKLLQSGNESDVVLHLQLDGIGVGDHLQVDPVLHLADEQVHRRFQTDHLRLPTLKLFLGKDSERIHL